MRHARSALEKRAKSAVFLHFSNTNAPKDETLGTQRTLRTKRMHDKGLQRPSERFSNGCGVNVQSSSPTTLEKVATRTLGTDGRFARRESVSGNLADGARALRIHTHLGVAS